MSIHIIPLQADVVFLENVATFTQEPVKVIRHCQQIVTKGLLDV